MERPANALTADALTAEAQKWVELSNGKAVLVGRVGISDVLKAAMEIPNFDALLQDEVEGKRKNEPASVSRRLREAEAAEKIVLAGVIDPPLSPKRGPGLITVRDFKREDIVILSNEILALSGYSKEEADKAGGSSGASG